MGTEFDYRREMGNLAFTPAQKAEMTRKLLEEVNSQHAAKHSVHSHRMGRIALIAACMAGILVVGAGATGALKSAGEAFANVFGGGAAETEIIDQIGRPIGASDTDHGLTITADAIIGDQYSVCVVYTLTREDGQIFDLEGDGEHLPLGFKNASLFTGVMGGSHGGSYFMDPVPGDNSIQYVEQSTSDMPVIGKTATAEFNDLRMYAEDGTVVPLVEGHWELKFDLNYEDTSVILNGEGQTFERNGLEYTVNEIQISPVSYTVNYTINAEPQWSHAESGKMSLKDETTTANFLAGFELLLVKTDGSVCDLGNTGGSMSVGDGVTVCARSGMFDQIQPLDEIASIRIAGLDFPLR